MGVMLDAPWAGQQFNPPSPLDIAALETALVNQLQAAVGQQVEVAHFPDRPENYRLTHRIGAALVVYRGANYGSMMATGMIVQERKFEFDVVVMVRGLGWGYGGEPSGASPGAYAILEAVRVALTGFEIRGCRKIYPTRERFVERDRQGGVWIYAISFIIGTMAVQPATTESFPLLAKGSTLEEGGITAIALAPASYTFNSSGQIQLAHRNISTVAVTSASGAAYIQGVDYTVDNVNGIIAIASGGAIAPGATVNAAYSYADVMTATAGETAPEA